MPRDYAPAYRRVDYGSECYCPVCGRNEVGGHGRMLEDLHTSNWREVFKYAVPERVLPGDETSGAQGPFKREDVIDIIAMKNGANDEGAWLGLFQLTDGRYAFVSANCDYTGWGCREGGFSVVSYHLDRLVRFGMTREEAQALGITPLRESAMLRAEEAL